jgi:ABC-type branched-subunit amino acid transport system substrate-binding protein
MISLLRRFSSCFLILMACGTAEAQQATDILVGVAYPASGPNNWLGQPSRDGFDQAFEDFNWSF